MADTDFFDGSLIEDFQKSAAAFLISIGLVASPAAAEQENNDAPAIIVEEETPPLNFFFQKGKEELTETSAQDFKKLANHLKETGDTFEIHGCASPEGSEIYNDALTSRRAHTIADMLQEEGITIDKINRTGQNKDIIGLGDACPPLNENEQDTPEEARRAYMILNPEYPPEPEVEYPDTSHLPWGGWPAAFDKAINGTPIPEAPETLNPQAPQTITVKP